MNEETEPKELTPKTVIHWSNTYKHLEILDKHGIFKTYVIRYKAQRFVENKCIDYIKKEDSKDGKGYYICKPIKGYNQTIYEMRPTGNQQFDCTCQFYNVVVKKQEITGLTCSHVCALKLQLKIWNWERRKSQELDGWNE